MKVKRLPPTLKKRQRYVVFEVAGEETFKKEEVYKSLASTGIKALGEIGFAGLGFWLTDFDENKQKGILKINHDQKDQAKALLALASTVNGKPARFSSMGVSGTIKKAKKKWW
ncbi:MAG: Rpp14/Pop5 family protein [archaeon]